METMLLNNLRESPSLKQLYGVTPVDLIPVLARFSNDLCYFEVIRCKANLLYGLLAHSKSSRLEREEGCDVCCLKIVLCGLHSQYEFFEQLSGLFRLRHEILLYQRSFVLFIQSQSY